MSGNRSGLLPCPFCGSEPLFIVGGPDLVGIQCNSARCVNPHISNVSEAFARELWNTRAPNQPLSDSVVERLRETLADAEAMDIGDDEILNWPNRDTDGQPNLTLGDLRKIAAAIPSAGGVEEPSDAMIDAALEAAWATKLFSCNRSAEDERDGMRAILAAALGGGQ